MGQNEDADTPSALDFVSLGFLDRQRHQALFQVLLREVVQALYDHFRILVRQFRPFVHVEGLQDHVEESLSVLDADML